jgi:thiamine-phosphate pyrophosphorylase
LDYSLYFITAEENPPGHTDYSLVQEAVAGGATIVQLRKKVMPIRQLLTLAEKLKELTVHFGVPLIINDRVDLALAVNADGVHLGLDDFPVERARRLLGSKKIIGATVRSAEQAARAQLEGADYLGAGAVYPTGSKAGAAMIGLGGLAEICRAVKLPVVGIGGIGPGKAGPVIRAGAAGVAVISALAGAKDPAGAARLLLDEIRQERAQKG